MNVARLERRARTAVRGALAVLAVCLAAPRAFGGEDRRDSGPEPGDWQAWVTLAESRYQEARYHDAIDAFERSLGAAPRDREEGIRRQLSHVLGALGIQYLNAGEGDLAEKTFLRALAQAEDYYAHFGLGYLYFIRVRDPDALSHLLSSLRHRPDHSETHKLLALLEYRQGRMSGAVSRLEEAQKRNPSDVESATLLSRWRQETTILARFRPASSKHFAVRLDPELQASTEPELLSQLEEAHEGLGDSLGAWPRDAVQVVFYTERNFHAATGLEHWVGGLYDGQLKIPVPAEWNGGAAEPPGLRETLRHEYVHVLVRHTAPDCPVWLNEGVAQYFEAVPAERGARRVAVYRRLAAGRDRRVPLERMPALLDHVSDVDAARWVYLQALGFVSFLAEKHGPFRLRLLLVALAEEHSLSRAVERAYGEPLQGLEEAWWREIERTAPAKS